MFKIIIKEDEKEVGEFNCENALISGDERYAILGKPSDFADRLNMVEKLLEIIILDSFQVNLRPEEKEKTFKDIKAKKYPRKVLEYKEKAFAKGLAFIEDNLRRRLKEEFYGEKVNLDSSKDFRVKVLNKDRVEVYSEDADDIMLSTDTVTSLFTKNKFENEEESKNLSFKLLMSVIEYVAIAFVSFENKISMTEVNEAIDKADKKMYKKVVDAMDEIFYNAAENYKMFFYEKRLNSGEKYVIDEDFARNYLMNERFKGQLKKLGFNFEENEEDDDDDDYDDPTESKFFS